MLFHTNEFAIFLAVVVLLIAAIRNQFARKVILLAASYLFYMWSSPMMVLPLLATTFIDYGIGRLLEFEEREPRRRTLLTISLVANLGLLAFFKYFNFFIENAQALLQSIGFDFTPALLELILPVGISFYTFHTMSYTIDVYKREIPVCRSAIDFALFITFFPVLVAGPILRAKNFLPQIERRVALIFEPATLMLAMRGLAKKVLVADNISPFVDQIFAEPGRWPSAVIWVATIGFSVQIYCDFSGYSDIARALARMFGYEIPLNFDRPYFARNPSDFWRRWHISLSTWLRDYLYIPLGGNRHGEARTYRNLMLTMLLGGLWHGASWNFVLWGFLHGLMLAVHRVAQTFLSARTARNVCPTLLAWAAMQYCVLLTWIAFRVRDTNAMFIAMRKFVLFDFNFSVASLGLSTMNFMTTLAVIALFSALHLWSYFRGDLDERIARLPLPAAVAVCVLMGLAFALFWPTGGQPFIYFQF